MTMALVLVIHDAADLTFVEGRLNPPLPALGFDRWISSVALDAGRAGKLSPAAAIAKSSAVLAVISSAASLDAHRERVAQARKTSTPVIAVCVKPVAIAAGDAVWSTLPLVPASDNDERFWHDLAAVLPALPSSSKRTTSGVVIPWDSRVYSALLNLAISRHDYHRSDDLVSALTGYLKNNKTSYPDDAAKTDLDELRRKRQFSLLSRYGEAVIASGVKNPTVRRLYAQSLIELADYASALKVLKKIVADVPPTHDESYEARGLIGRVYKQQYINAPQDPQATRWMTHAIDAYYSVYKNDPEQVWHGVNAASLMLRAARDERRPGDPKTAETIATEVVSTLDRRQQLLQKEKKILPAFDCASRVEALVDLGKFAEASAALDVYLAHPSMHAFEVSSTYRQFDEVLQLHDVPEGRDIVDRLWQAVETHRAGGMIAAPAADPMLGRARDRSLAEPVERRHMLLRVSDPAWQPSDVPDLQIHVRMGTVLSITGSEATVKSLLKDPSVIGVEDSGRAVQAECAHSVPFIGVKDHYTSLGGTFSEKGDAALVAIIDEGIDVLHHAFQDDAGKSRILGVWDQRDKSGKAPSAHNFGAEFNFGAFYDRDTIQKWIEDSRTNPPTISVPDALSRNVKGHGTHVASIAAGRKVGNFAGGVAPEARMLIVVAATDPNIPYSMSHLAALKFINEFATKENLPVVVNLSAGMNAGAHDGRSALEVAFDEFSGGGRTAGRIIVKSAGNERTNRGHAKVELLPDSADTLKWESFTDPAWNRDRVELWWDSINTLRFRLTSPANAQSDWVDLATPVVKGRLVGGGPFRMELVRRHPDNGDSRLVVELGGATFTPLAAGTWTLEIEAVAIRTAAEIHAWLEKGGTQPSVFLDHADENMTLSVPGTAFSVITVGAVGSSKPFTMVDTSSFGPTRDQRSVQKPDVAAPGFKVEAAQGGTFDDICDMTGTSMAAPHVTGTIALLLSRLSKIGQTIPSASQVGAALRQNAQNSTGSYTTRMGFGVVNVEAFLIGF